MRPPPESTCRRRRVRRRRARALGGKTHRRMLRLRRLKCPARVSYPRRTRVRACAHASGRTHLRFLGMSPSVTSASGSCASSTPWAEARARQQHATAGSEKYLVVVRIAVGAALVVHLGLLRGPGLGGRGLGGAYCVGVRHGQSERGVRCRAFLRLQRRSRRAVVVFAGNAERSAPCRAGQPALAPSCCRARRPRSRAAPQPQPACAAAVVRRRFKNCGARAMHISSARALRG